MRKKGYSLSEMLITLSIIAVVSAMLLPLANRAKPDANKAMFVKAYDTVVSVVDAIVNSQIIYPPESNDGFDYTTIPLANTEQTTLNNINVSFGPGNAKFCQAMAYYMGVNGNCSPLSPLRYDSMPRSFTVNGMDFWVYTRHENNARYLSQVYVDVNGSTNGKNCIVTDNNCTSPDRFLILVSPSGQVDPGDVVGNAYLDTRSNWSTTRGSNIPRKNLDNAPTGQYVRRCVTGKQLVAGACVDQ